MKNLTVEKSNVLAAYKAGSADQKEMLEHLFGKEAFAFDWREITSYEKACEVLGIEPREFKEVGDRPQYMRMANAMQQLLVICEAINGDDGWCDKDCKCYCPIFVLYSKQEMQELGEAECKRKGIHQLLAAAYGVNAEFAGVSCAYTCCRGVYTAAYYGFPLCLNSKGKTDFVSEKFFDLICQCYGVTPKMGEVTDNETSTTNQRRLWK